MKKFFVVILAFVVILLVTAIPEQTEAATTRTVYVAATSAVPLKKAASNDSKLIATLSKGEYVTQISSTSGWSYVLYKGKKGYVKTGNLKKKTATAKIVNAKAGLKIYATPSSKAKVYATIKNSTKVQYYGKIDSTWSFVQVGNVTGFALTKSLKDVTTTTSTATAGKVSFYQGLVPAGIKTGTYLYNLESMYGYGLFEFNKYTYSGSKASGKFSLKATHKEFNDPSNAFTYTETKDGFTFDLATFTVVKINYPAKAGAKKTYTASVFDYDDDGNEVKSTVKFTSTVKIANGTTKDSNNKTVKNAVVVEVTDGKGFTGTYYFKLNTGLVSFKEKYSDDVVYGSLEKPKY